MKHSLTYRYKSRIKPRHYAAVIACPIVNPSTVDSYAFPLIARRLNDDLNIKLRSILELEPGIGPYWFS